MRAPIEVTQDEESKEEGDLEVAHRGGRLVVDVHSARGRGVSGRVSVGGWFLCT